MNMTHFQILDACILTNFAPSSRKDLFTGGACVKLSTLV